MERGEDISAMEPLRIGDERVAKYGLTDLALELTDETASLRSQLPAGIAAPLADLIRAMNCYYSNLIEGHDTHPIQIERALKGDFSQEPKKRELQLEARAHVEVQAWLDNADGAIDVCSEHTLREIHRRFYELIPEQLRHVVDRTSGERLEVTGGELRERDVEVGNHRAVSPEAVPRFLKRFAIAYSTQRRSDAVIMSAAAHHRLLWIHPFLDGNGRVARLMTHHMLRLALRTESLWSVSRGLARDHQRYKQLLANCDLPRRNDLDGRGALSEETLAEFTTFFLETAIDQVKFMRSLMAPDALRERVVRWTIGQVAAGALPTGANRIIEAVLYRGSLERSAAKEVLGVTDRHARRVTSALVSAEVLTSPDDRAPLHLAFPARLAADWMPGLFPPA